MFPFPYAAPRLPLPAPVFSSPPQPSWSRSSPPSLPPLQAAQAPQPWCSEPGAAVLAALPRMRVQDLPMGNEQVLLLLCDSIDSALDDGNWSRDALDALEGPHGALLNRFNRVDFNIHAEGCLVALVRMNRLLRRLYSDTPQGRIALGKSGKDNALAAARNKITLLVRQMVDDARLRTSDDMDALADALEALALCPAPPASLPTLASLPAPPSLPAPASLPAPPSVPAPPGMQGHAAASAVEKAVASEPVLVNRPAPDQAQPAPGPSWAARVAAPAKVLKPGSRAALNGLLPPAMMGGSPRLACRRALPAVPGKAAKLPIADLAARQAQQPESALASEIRIASERVEATPAARNAARTGSHPPGIAAGPVQQEKKVDLAKLRQAWFAALKGSSNPKPAMLARWLQGDPQLFLANDGGRPARDGLWHAISHGKTGAVVWMTEQACFGTYLLARCQQLPELIGSFDLDNENRRQAALTVLLQSVRKHGNAMQALVDALTPALVADAPATRALLVRFKLLDVAAQPAALITQVKPRGAAARRKQKQAVQRLAREGAKIERQHRQRIAQQSAAHALVREIAGAADTDGMTGLMKACCEGDLAQLELLLKLGIDVQAVDVNGRNALMHAAARGHVELFLPLMLQDVDVDAECAAGLSAIDYARSNGTRSRMAMAAAIDMRVLAHLRRLGPQLALKGAYDIAPYIHHASVAVRHTSEMSEAEMRLELGEGDDVEEFLGLRRDLSRASAPAQLLAIRDSHGLTALWHCIELGSPLMVRTMLDLGADINERDEGGNTPLIISALLNDTRNAEICLFFKAGIDCRNLAGETALMIAARQGYLCLFNFILGNGANWKLLDHAGQSAYDHALANGNDFIVAMLARLATEEE